MVAPFTTEERSLINELRFDDIGTEQKATILEKTFSRGVSGSCSAARLTRITSQSSDS